MNAKRIVPFFIKISACSRRGHFPNAARNLQIACCRHRTSASSEKSVTFTEPSQQLSPLESPTTAATKQPPKKEISEESAIFQLQRCGKLSHVRSLDLRREMQQNLWKSIQENKQVLSINLYNSYIQVCIENELPIDYKTFLQLAQPHHPNQQTYVLLLVLASKLGDVNEAVDILTEMKSQGIPADESVFNALIVGYTLHKGLEGANYVLGTMKLAKVPITAKTNWAILDGLVRYGNRNEFRQFLEIIPKVSQREKEYVELLHALGARGQHAWLDDILADFDWDAKDRAFMNDVEEICLQLVHRGQPDAAIHYYTTFVDPQPNKSYGSFLLKEMLACKISIEKIIDAGRRLLAKNSFALFDLAQMTLQKQLVSESYQTFQHLPYVRPHFFWPIIQVEGRARGEFGVFSVLKKMNEFNVKPDYATFEDFVLKYFNLSDPRNTMASITQVPNIMQRDVLSPMVALLLKEKRVEDAMTLCTTSNKIPLSGEQVMKHLANAWKHTKNMNVVPVLQKICETNPTSTDWAGVFLERCAKACQSDMDFAKLAELIKMLEKVKLKVTSMHYDHIVQYVSETPEVAKHRADVESLLERVLDITKQEVAYHTHPKDMNIEELENHLVELEAKNMETRGVIRKLILSHAKFGHHERVQQLRLYAKSRNYEETAGMKSSLFHALSLAGDVKTAKNVYEELKSAFPSFKIDSFKVVDYATLLVRNGAVDEAISVLSKETKPIKVDNSMVRNCWNLLGAAQKPEDAFKLFQLLVERNFCKPTNVILGPMLRPFVKPETVDKLVTNFCNCAEKYKATPLQLEVLCVVLESKNEKLLQKVINAISKVHGASGARLGLIAALAEMGLEKPILKLLSERSQVKLAELTNRIQRWITEGKILPLKTLEAANKRLSIGAFDNVLTSSAIMKIHCNRQDFQAALAYWNELQEQDGQISKECAKELVYQLTKHNFNVPVSLQNASK